MTQDKAFKSAVRARMAEHGEPYNVARRAVMADDEAAGSPSPTSPDGLEPEQESADGQQHSEEDYYARYEREAELAGAGSGSVRAMKLAERLQGAADRAQDAADYAEELAAQAEEAADEADEKAGMAEEAASSATEWASPEELRQAERRVELMQERAGRAREKAEAARERAEQAQERADQAQEAADQAFEDAEDDGDSEPEWHGGRPSGSHGHPPTPPRPPWPPRPPRPPHSGPAEPQNAIDRLMSRLDELEHRFTEAQDRAATFLNRFRQDDASSD